MVGKFVAEIGEVHITGSDTEWKIDTFFTLPEEEGQYFFSPAFPFNGSFWRIVLCPHGSNGSVGYVSLYLTQECCVFPDIIEVSLALKSVNVKKELERHCTVVFDADEYIHGFPRFILRTELIRRKAEFVPSDVLTILCSMKTSKCTGNASDVTISKCCHCKEIFDVGFLSSHEKKCKDKPMNCPPSSDVLLLKLLCDHKCHHEGTEDFRSVCQDYSKMLLDEISHDAIIKIGNKEFQAQEILMARSQILQPMLSHDITKENTDDVDVPNCDPESIDKFLLYYVYCGKVKKLNQGNMLTLFYIADKYGMEDLKKESSEFIQKSLSIANICDVIQLALNLKDSNLQDFATEYFINNVLDILYTVQWQTFMKNNCIIANELMKKTYEKKDYI